MTGRHRDSKSKSNNPHHHRTGGGSGHRISDDRRIASQPNHRQHNNIDATSSSTSSLQEERIAVQQREIQTLLQDNKRLAESHVALKQDLALAKQELIRLASAASSVKAERDAEVRDVYERSLKVESAAQAADAVTLDLAQVRADVERLRADVKELTEELDGINCEVEMAKSDAPEVSAVREETEVVQQEIIRGRAAIELENETRSCNFEQSLIMDKNVRFVSQEMEKLRAQLATTERRATAAVAAANPNPQYGGTHIHPGPGDGGNPYVDPYCMYKIHGGPTFVSGAIANIPYEMQQTQNQAQR